MKYIMGDLCEGKILEEKISELGVENDDWFNQFCTVEYNPIFGGLSFESKMNSPSEFITPPNSEFCCMKFEKLDNDDLYKCRAMVYTKLANFIFYLYNCNFNVRNGGRREE